MSMNNIRTSARLLRFTVMATLSLTVAAVMPGCSTKQHRVGIVSPTIYETTEAETVTASMAVGQPAPFFSLPNQDGKAVSSANLKGSWIVLHFYPEEDTPECVCEATEFTDRLSEFRKMNARVFGVNADTVESHLNFRHKYGLELDLLSDPEYRTMRQYGAHVDTPFGNTNATRIVRSTCLIDQNGHIAYHWPEVRPQGHAERVKDKLAQLQYGATVTSLDSEFDIFIMATLFNMFR
ncbi:MAG: peroxiredoxin [Phycisphaerae bacterium]|nr:peroxiredoxin [Phycisphaerae bacterium]